MSKRSFKNRILKGFLELAFKSSHPRISKALKLGVNKKNFHFEKVKHAFPVTSSNPQVTSSNLRVKSSNRRVTS